MASPALLPCGLYKPENRKSYSSSPAIKKTIDGARTISQKMEPPSFFPPSSSSPDPHILIFPLPAQGHVNSMLKLAELLGLAGVKVTFLNSDYNHDQLLRHTDIVERFQRYPGFEFRTVWDGLPPDYPRTGESFMALFAAMRLNTKRLFRELVVGVRPQVDCIIGDGILGFVFDVAMELDIPLIHFRTVSACSFWAYFCLPDTIAAGELPIKGMLMAKKNRARHGELPAMQRPAKFLQGERHGRPESTDGNDRDQTKLSGSWSDIKHV